MGSRYLRNRRNFNSMGLAHDAGTSLIVAALPTEDDPVRKISSEKEPHLTLLYLGNPLWTLAQKTMVAQYIEHAASNLGQFTLDVESRGTLGDQNADVLFFDKTWSKNIIEFRSQLLRNDLISAAYLSADQFPQWNPHMTLGYPKSPAKEIPDFGRFYGVSFDKVALWTGDYAGPTFDLKRRYYDMAVAMSQTDRGRSFVESTLNHYGVKGMHWGVRKAESGGGSSKPTSSGPKPRVSEDAKSVEKAFGKINRGGTDTLSNQELQHLVNRLNLEQQYSRLTTSGTAQAATTDRGHTAVKTMLSYGKTANDIHKFMRSPTGKLLKNGFKVAKTAANAYVNPVGTAIDLITPKNHFTNVG